MAGWLPEAAFAHAMYWLNLSKYRYLDFAAVLTYNHKPKGLLESIYAEIVVIIFMGILGIGFSMLTKAIFSKNIYLKAWLYGILAWFLIYAVITMYQLKYIYPVDTGTSFVKLIAASIWGISMAWAYFRLNRKYGVQNQPD